MLAQNRVGMVKIYCTTKYSDLDIAPGIAGPGQAGVGGLWRQETGVERWGRTPQHQTHVTADFSCTILGQFKIFLLP